MNAVLAGILVIIGLLPALAVALLLRRSTREPSPALAYGGAVLAIGVGAALIFTVRAMVAPSLGVTTTVFFLILGSVMIVRGELGRVQTAWAARRTEGSPAS